MNVESFNQNLFLALNAPAGLAGAPLYVAIGAAKYSILALAVIVIWRWLNATSAARSMLVHVVLTTVPALAINFIVGLVYFHPRPFMIGLGHTYLAHLPEASFPSDHATFMWTIALGLVLWSPTRPSSWFALFLAALTSWARVFLGVHFPLDIAGSVVVALLCVAILVPMQPATARYIAGPIEIIYTLISKGRRWR